LVTVADTGSGMPPEVRSQAFEPFFTTKSEGHGSGLGLSMVYGFVKQSGGYVAIDSTVGAGTTVRIYLPREDAAISPDPQARPTPSTGGKETVLVVEDDEQVRATVIELLTDLGYKVLSACGGEQALALLRSGEAVDLLFSDVVMPGPVKSPALAREARERHPGIAVLFTSGYPRDVIARDGRLDAGVELLRKPYTRDELASTIRRLLGASQQRAGNGRAVAGSSLSH
jgi:CheY-like chemotaxis protein